VYILVNVEEQIAGMASLLMKSLFVGCMNRVYTITVSAHAIKAHAREGKYLLYMH